MNTGKFIKGTIAGGIAFFLIGWVVYGVLLADFMESNYNNCMSRPMEGMIMWAMVIGNLAYGAFFALIFDWAGVRTIIDGVKKGAILSFILSLSMAMYYYSMSTMYENMNSMVVEILVGTVVAAIAGAVVAWAMNMGNKE